MSRSTSQHHHLSSIIMATVSEQEFMDIVHNYRAAWDRGCSEFKDRNKKSNSWMEIARLAGVDVKVLQPDMRPLDQLFHGI